MTQASPAGAARASSSFASLPMPSAVQDPDSANTCGAVRLMAAAVAVGFKDCLPGESVAAPNPLGSGYWSVATLMSFLTEVTPSTPMAIATALSSAA